jgi:hypothetical protein
MAAYHYFHTRSSEASSAGPSSSPGDAAADDSSAHYFDWTVFGISFIIIWFVGMFFVGVIYYTGTTTTL